MPSSSNASLRSKMRNLARETLPERSKSTVVTPISSSTRSSPRTTKTKSNLKPTPPDRAPPPRERFREAAGMSGQPKRPKTSASTQQSVIIRDNKGWCISGQDHTDEDDSDTVTVKKSVNMTPRHNYSPIRPASSSMDGGRRRSGVANSSRGKHGQPLSTLDRVNGRSQGRSGSPAARAGLRTSPSESPGPSLETQRFYDEFANQLIGGNGMNSTASDDELFSEDDVRDGEGMFNPSCEHIRHITRHLYSDKMRVLRRTAPCNRQPLFCAGIHETLQPSRSGGPAWFRQSKRYSSPRSASPLGVPPAS